MTSIFPHAPYAEDQNYSKTILRFHVWRSGLTVGAILSIPTAVASTLFWGPRTLPTFSSRLLTHSFRGTLGGLLFGILAVEGRMYGREDIEWQDRSWRLLESKGQVEVDDWILGGGALGVVAGVLAARKGRLTSGMGRTAIAGFGLGTVAGTSGYMGWRHGVKGGR